MSDDLTHPSDCLYLSGGPHRNKSEMWLRPNRNLDWMGIARYSATINAYALAEKKGFDLADLANQKHEHFRLTGDWSGSFEDLRYCLFFEARRERFCSSGADPVDDFVFLSLNQAICDAWESETGQQPDLSPLYRRELLLAIAVAQSAGAIARQYFSKGTAKQADHLAEQRIFDLLTPAFPAYGYRGEELGLRRQPSDQGRHHWLVDPQDGTSAASKGFRGAAVSICLLRAGHPVLGVIYAYAAPDHGGDLFFWAEGMRSVHRNDEYITRQWPVQAASSSTALISQDADLAAEINAALLWPMRYRLVPGIAYRLALVAAGEGDLAVSLNGPTGWDIAGGHALLLGAGADLFNQHGDPVRYDQTGHPSRPVSYCFGGSPQIVENYFPRPWQGVFQRTSRQPAQASLSLLIPGRLIEDAALLSRAQGCLLGQLAGDALGSLVKFQGAKEISRRYPQGPALLEDGGHWSTIAGQPTDDSELALALARSIIDTGSYDREQVAQSYAKWRVSNPFDCGNTIGTALSAAVRAHAKRASAAQAATASANGQSQANGALMRISPLAIFGARLDTNTLMGIAREDARLTHPHPVCQDANAIFTAAVAFAIRTGASPQEAYRQALEWTRVGGLDEAVVQRLQAASTAPPAEFEGSKMGWVLIAFQNAFFQLLHSTSVQEGVVATVRAGGDTDTNAAIAGALLGAVHGRPNLPEQWVHRLLSCRPIAGLQDVQKPRPARYWPVDVMTLAERLLTCER